MDTASREFRHESVKESFPFEEIKPTSMKIKSIPIKLQWPHYGGGTSSPVKKQLAGKRRTISVITVDEPANQIRWFRSPPKVPLVAGILGCKPNIETRGENPGRGEREVGGDSESEHHNLLFVLPSGFDPDPNFSQSHKP